MMLIRPEYSQQSTDIFVDTLKLLFEALNKERNVLKGGIGSILL